ncbi:MAG TPA: putative hydro-lyase [Candidatus Methylomirabilis sp.]|nr:putative hydro-lyase [Candidatus Methylomirabilis sp.]
MSEQPEIFRKATPPEVRAMIRDGKWRKPTAGILPGYVQVNLVILPRELSYDFLLFAQRNPKPCPVIEVTDPGSPEPKLTAPGADLRTDVPKYRIYRGGKLDREVTDLLGVWTPDLVAFLLGCSFTFETGLLQAGIPVRHIEEGKNVSMFVTSIPCTPAGAFSGPLVVTMRPIPAPMVPRAVQISGRFPAVHGAPVHVGDPGALGIRDLGKPDFGDAVTIRHGEVPVFWACGVTPQAVAMQAKPPLMITHAPGHMFVTDLRDEVLAVF